MLSFEVDKPKLEDEGKSDSKPISNTKKSWFARLRGWALLLFLGGFAALSGTVLKEQIIETADWLREHETAGYFVIGVLGWAFIMIGGSANFLDLICGYVYGTTIGFAVSYVTKIIATASAYLAGRYLFQDMLLKYFFQEYIWLGAVALLIKDRPWLSNLLLRLCIIPAAIKSYALGAIEDPPLPFFVSAMAVMALFSYTLAEIGSKLTSPNEMFKAKNKQSQILETSAAVACVLVVVGGAFFGRKYIMQAQALKAKKEAEEGRRSPSGGTDEHVEDDDDDDLEEDRSRLETIKEESLDDLTELDQNVVIQST